MRRFQQQQRCRDLARKLGGIYVKAAQLVASLQGGAGTAIPEPYLKALASLTDDAAPTPFLDAADVAKAELGAGRFQKLVHIDPQPVATGSLAQVHKVLIEDFKRPAAVKIQHARLGDQIAGDFAVFKALGGMIRPGGYDLMWLVSDVERAIAKELNFQNEARNASQVLEILKDPGVRYCNMHPAVHIPAVHAVFSTGRVLATEFVDDMVRLDDDVALANYGLSKGAVGSIIANVFADLVLIHGLVHGDPHAGNVYARPRPADPQGAAGAAVGGDTNEVVLLDHGLYHHLSRQDRLQLCSLISHCASPWPNKQKVLELSSHFAPGPAAALFPLLISPLFALATGLSFADLQAASESRLPDKINVEDVWKALETIGQGPGGTEILGTMHSLGYVRGLLNTLNVLETDRVTALLRAATSTLCEESSSSEREHWLSQHLAAIRFRLLVLVLRIAAAFATFLQKINLLPMKKHK